MYIVARIFLLASILHLIGWPPQSGAFFICAFPWLILKSIDEPGVIMVDTVELQRVVRLHITLLPEGVYLATSEDVQGLVA